MGRMMGLAAPPSEPEAEREPPPPPPNGGRTWLRRADSPPPGRDVQDQQMKAMQAIFNQQMLSKTEKSLTSTRVSAPRGASVRFAGGVGRGR